MSHRTALGLVLTWHDVARFADWPSEQVLERYVANRDEAAFRELLRRHAPHVWAVCRRELASIDLAEDAFQNTFLSLIRKGHQIRQLGALAGWLDRTARRAAGEIRRQSARRTKLEESAPVRADATPDESGQRFEAIRAAVADLPDRYRLPITYRYLAGLTAAEVAAVLGVPEETGRTQVKRGLELLRTRLAARAMAVGLGVTTIEAALKADSVPASAWSAAVAAAVRTGTVRR